MISLPLGFSLGLEGSSKAFALGLRCSCCAEGERGEMQSLQSLTVGGQSPRNVMLGLHFLHIIRLLAPLGFFAWPREARVQAC